MTIFRGVEFQISPRPLLFLHQSEADDEFCKTLELNNNPRVFCKITTHEYAGEQMSALAAELGMGFGGFATVDQTYSVSDVTLMIPDRQFELLTRVALAFYTEPRIISVRSAMSTDFQIIQNKRYHKIEVEPSITVALDSAV